MRTRQIEVQGAAYRVPGNYRKGEPRPTDPKGSIFLKAQTDQSSCFVIAAHKEANEVPTFDQQATIQAIRASLLDNQGIIEVESGNTGDRQFIYSIIKQLQKEDDFRLRVQYVLSMDISTELGATHFQGHFTEEGTTGVRDSTVFQMFRSKIVVADGLEGWTADPYDPDFDKGALMNLSEQRECDKLFPKHPLSMAREFVACVLESIENTDESDAVRGDDYETVMSKSQALMGKAGKLFGRAARAASSAASVAVEATGEAKDAIGEKIEEAKAAKEEPDEYDLAVIAYNLAYTDLSDAGSELYNQRVRTVDLMGHVETLINSIANRPKSFDSDLGEVFTHKHEFREIGAFAEEELTAARTSAKSAGTGVAAGMAVASMAPHAALWVATTFGTASTGAAISTLSGAAATQAALAWLGGGALAAGGGGVAAGNALLALAGPIGWGIAGATLLASIVLFTKKRFDLREEKQQELTAVKENTEKVSEMAAEVGTLLEKTNGLREKLSSLYSDCLKSFGADFSVLEEADQDRLAALVNNTLSLSRLLSERVETSEAPESQGE